MEEIRASSLYSDICVCCGKPVPEGRMVCYSCETGKTSCVPCTKNSFLEQFHSQKKDKSNEL